LAQGLSKNSCLKTLIVADNHFGDEGLEYFTKEIIFEYGNHFTLTNLDLSFNFFSDKSGVKFANALSQNKTITTLKLEGNNFDHLTAKAFLNTVRNNNLLYNLDLSNNSI